MCDRCEDLEEEIERLKGLLGQNQRVDQIGKVRQEFGVRPLEARVLLALYQTPAALHRDRLHTIIYGDDPDGGADPKIFDALVFYIRKNIGKDMIRTVWAFGWELSPACRARLDKHFKRDRLAA